MDILKIISSITLFIFISLILFIILSIVMNISFINFISAISSDEVLFAIKLSIFTSIISIIIGSLIGVPSGYYLARNNFKGKNIIDSLIELPIILPPLISGFALLIFFGNMPIGQFISKYIVDIIFNPVGIIVAQFFVSVPYIIKTSKSIFEKISVKYEYMALSLGLNNIECFYKIVLPMAKQGILTGIILAWSRAIGEFGATLMLAGATKMKTETLPIAVYLNISIGNIDLALTISFIFLLIGIFIIFTVKKLLKYNNSIGGDSYE